MKGIIFKELVSMCESTFGDEVVDELMESVNLKSQGAYTAVGNYDHTEILELVTELSKITNTDVKTLIVAFGGHLMKIFAKVHPEFFKHEHVFDFLKSIDNYIHVEVRKLYPDSNPPEILCNQLTDKTMEMTYKSHRPFADVAEALLLGSMEHYNVKANVSAEELGTEAGTHRKFTISI